jgi:hypothetical protein
MQQSVDHVRRDLKRQFVNCFKLRSPILSPAKISPVFRLISRAVTSAYVSNPGFLLPFMECATGGWRALRWEEGSKQRLHRGDPGAPGFGYDGQEAA